MRDLKDELMSLLFLFVLNTETHGDHLDSSPPQLLGCA